MTINQKAIRIIGLAILALVLLPALASAQAVLVVKNNAVAVGGDFIPDELLHVKDADATQTFMKVENTNGAVKPAGARFTNAAQSWDFRLDALGRFIITLVGTGGAEMTIDDANGNVSIRRDLFVNGVGGCTGCDEVFDEGYPIPTIEEHAELMWENGYLPGIGPSPVDEPINVFRKTAGVLNELEKAHIYIEQLNARLLKLEQALAAAQAE